MAGRLFDKVAIITGAGTGIGEAIALKFAQEGARVLLVGLPDDPVEDVARLINGAGGFAEIYLGDIAEEWHAEAARRGLPGHLRLYRGDRHYRGAPATATPRL